MVPSLRLQNSRQSQLLGLLQEPRAKSWGPLVFGFRLVHVANGRISLDFPTLRKLRKELIPVDILRCWLVSHCLSNLPHRLSSHLEYCLPLVVRRLPLHRNSCCQDATDTAHILTNRG